MPDDFPTLIPGKPGQPLPATHARDIAPFPSYWSRQKMIAEITRMALEYAPKALAGLMEIADTAKDPKTRAMAYGMLLDRGLGRSVQRQEHTGAEGAPITVVIGLKSPDSVGVQSANLPITPLIGTSQAGEETEESKDRANCE